MRAFYKSIRWRLQVWYTILLIIVVSAFAVVSFLFLRKNLYDKIDAQLDRSLALVASGIRPYQPGSGDSDLVFRRPKVEDSGYTEINLDSFYYTVWLNETITAKYPKDTRIIEHPETIPTTSGNEAGEIQRSRLGYRELIRFSNNQTNRSFGTLKPAKGGRGKGGNQLPRAIILVGCSLENTQLEVKKLAWVLIGVGMGILAFGVISGWLLCGRTIQPIQTMSEAARDIADGDLSKRININDTESELGELAEVLNQSFERLKSARERQAQFTGDASHELRTPAFVILSQAQSALRRDRSEEQYKEGFRVCENAAQEMKGLIESLLTLARHDSGEESQIREACKLDLITESVVDLLRPLATAKDITLVDNLQSTDTIGDPGQLRQVITNLLSNAIEYTGTGGEVRILVERNKDNNVIIQVKDNGTGIHPKDLPHLFDRFYRADPSRTGSQHHTGLGLAISKAVITAHGGEIRVESKPGVGSEFTVELI